jgi:hypothetical protein
MRKFNKTFNITLIFMLTAVKFAIIFIMLSILLLFNVSAYALRLDKNVLRVPSIFQNPGDKKGKTTYFNCDLLFGKGYITFNYRGVKIFCILRQTPEEDNKKYFIVDFLRINKNDHSILLDSFAYIDYDIDSERAISHLGFDSTAYGIDEHRFSISPATIEYAKNTLGIDELKLKSILSFRNRENVFKSTRGTYHPAVVVREDYQGFMFGHILWGTVIATAQREGRKICVAYRTAEKPQLFLDFIVPYKREASLVTEHEQTVVRMAMQDLNLRPVDGLLIKKVDDRDSYFVISEPGPSVPFRNLAPSSLTQIFNGKTILRSSL